MRNLSSTVHNLEPTTISNSGSVPVELEGCEDVQFKHCAIIEFLTAGIISAIDIHCCMQAGYGDNVLMQGQSDVGYGSLGKKKGRKQVCVTKQGWGGQ
jgi:hypothetical protein